MLKHDYKKMTPQDTKAAKQKRNGYFLDPEDIAETVRLIDQSAMASRLAEHQPFPAGVEPNDLQRVLDLACGPGNWVLDVAFDSPHLEAVGMDISKITIEYARARACSQGLSNAVFFLGDVTEPLEHPDMCFDYVNARFLMGVLKRDQWPALLQECKRVLKPDGSICLTEGEWALSSSPAYQKYTRYLSQALKLAGYSFSADGFELAITPVLGSLLRETGFQVTDYFSYCTELSYGAKEHYNWFANCRSLFLQSQPFLLDHLPQVTGEELDALYNQVMIEMQQESFCAVGSYLSLLARKPQGQEQQ